MLALLYILFGSYLTHNCIFLVDKLKKAGLNVGYADLFIFGFVMPFVLPVAFMVGAIKKVFGV